MIITEMDPSPQDQEPTVEVDHQMVKHECNKFLKTLQDFSSYVHYEFVNLIRDLNPQSNESLKSLTQKLKELFKGRPEFISGCNVFLPKTHQLTVPTIRAKPSTETRAISVRCRKRKRHLLSNSDESDDKLEEMIGFINKVAERFYDPRETEDVFRKFLEVFVNDRRKRKKSNGGNEDEGIMELQCYKEAIELFEGHPDMVDGFLKILPRMELPAFFRWIDYSTCKATCDPSYRVIPKFFPIDAATQRTSLEHEVLNDSLRCTPCTSSTAGEEQQEKEKPKPDWDDLRFELDVKLHRVEKTLGSIRVLMEKVEKDDGISEIYVEDYFSEMDWVFIEKCYKEQKLNAMHVLTKSNNLAAFTLLFRVLKRQEEKLKQERSCLDEKKKKMSPSKSNNGKEGKRG